jgi:hypothetical protein
MPVCIATATTTALLATNLFTLSWTHSVEKTQWQETWRVSESAFEIIEARVKGSGAGMEPPEGAVLKDGWWTYHPQLAPQPELILAASGATEGGWELCYQAGCLILGAEPSVPVHVTICEGENE